MKSNHTNNNENRGVTLWFTGLPCSGKTTVSQLVFDQLQQSGARVELLDGDIVRQKLTKGLGFSREDRDENIRRIGFVCHLLTGTGFQQMPAAFPTIRRGRMSSR